jgi:hypothetical protein
MNGSVLVLRDSSKSKMPLYRNHYMHITQFSLFISLLRSLATTVQGNHLQRPFPDAATAIGTRHLLLILSFNTIKI